MVQASNKYLVSKRGIWYRQYGEPISETNYRNGETKFEVDNIDIQRLLTAYKNRKSKNTTFKLCRLMAAAFTTAVGNFSDWLEFNVKRCERDVMLQFYRDTVIYLNGGSRELRPMLWLNLIAEDEASTRNIGTVNFNDLRIPTTEEAISFWLQNDQTIEDFFTTIEVLFGENPWQ